MSSAGELGARTKRRLENKATSEYVIKASLDRSLVDASNKPRIIADLCSRVASASKATHRMSMAINLLIRSHLQGCSLVDVVLPDFLSSSNVTLLRQLMTGGGQAAKLPASVSTFLDQYGALLPPVPQRHNGDGNTFTRAADLYKTNYKTYINTTFRKRQVAYCIEWCIAHHLSKYDADHMLRLINGWSQRRTYVCNKKMSQAVAFHRSFLKLEDEQRMCDVWISQNYEHAIVYFALLNNYTSRVGRKKAFLLAPVARVGSTFIHIDTDVLYGVMKSLKLTEENNKKAFVARQDDEWNCFLNTQRWLTVKQRDYAKFTYTIQTDGVAVCIHYRRPKILQSAPYVHKKRADDRVIGVDPGRVTMFAGIEEDENGRWKTYRLTRAMYYYESGIIKANKTSATWNKQVKSEIEALSHHSAKGASMRRFCDYLKAVNRTYDTLWNEYLKRRWGRQKFVLYSGKKRTFDTFLNTLVDNSGRRVVLAYGDAGFASGGKGELSVPTTTMMKVCKRRYTTILVDEYLTSQIHHDTTEKMATVMQNGKTVRGLRWCYSTKGGKFVDRDVNAALNIKRCYELEERPYHLSREAVVQDQPEPKRLKNIVGQARRLLG